MGEVRHRIEAHRDDVSVLLEQANQTAKLYSGFRLAGAVGHLARAQALLKEELAILAEEETSPPLKDTTEPSSVANDETPVDGIDLTGRSDRQPVRGRSREGKRA